MYHLYDVLIDIKGNALPGYRVLLRQPGGGAIVPIYADNNGTPIFAASGLVNAALTDAQGNYSLFVELGTYDIEFRSPNDAFLKTVGSVLMAGGPPGTPGDTGPADNTYTSYAALLASDPARKSARLVGDTDTPPQQDGNFNYSGGAWVRQRASGVTFLPAGAGGALGDLEAYLRQGWVIPDMFRQTGAVDDTSMIQALFASGNSLILIPADNYAISGDLILPARNVAVTCSSGAIFNAGANNLKMFKTTQLTFGVQWRGGTVDGNGFSGIAMFDLVGFRAAGACIESASAYNVETGINLRDQCWDLSIRNFYSQTVGSGIIIGQGCNAVTVDHPGINGFREAGIRVLTGTDALPAVGNNIIGGYVQDGPNGILDSARSTSINGTYFEACTEADIHFDGAIMPIVQRSYHSAGIGPVCVKARNTNGARIDNVTLHGDRSLGLFDIPKASNAYCRGTVARTADINTILGDYSGLQLDRALTGTLEAGDGGYDTAKNRPYTVMGPDTGSLFQRGIANSFDDIVTSPGLAINGLQQATCGYQLVGGGDSFTFSNMADGQSFTLFLKAAGTPASVTVAGTALDMTGVADGKRKKVVVTNVPGVTPLWLDEGPWK